MKELETQNKEFDWSMEVLCSIPSGSLLRYGSGVRVQSIAADMGQSVEFVEQRVRRLREQGHRVEYFESMNGRMVYIESPEWYRSQKKCREYWSRVYG